MSSKIEIERVAFQSATLLDPITNDFEFGIWLQAKEHRTSVVEHQPVEVLGYSVVGNRYAIAATKGEIIELHEGYADHMIELVDRKHVTSLQTELAELSKLLGQARGMVNGASDEWHNSVEKVLGHE